MTVRFLQSAIIIILLTSNGFSADVPKTLESEHAATEEDISPFLKMEFDHAPLIDPALADNGLNKQSPEDSDIPVVVNDKVEGFIKYFQTNGKWFFVKWLGRSTRYLPMIKEILDENGLPDDLAYLALIESGFSPYARSQAKAVGMWQFIQWTARVNGLRVDWWIDERRDPEKATRAAARHLNDLYGKFGSWHLAAAGYNGGEGRIRRALRDYPAEDFWTLANYKMAMKRETRDYVPK
ncbi:MAG: lytic transglycosylase domain-containing protein, partial [Deltaproteobacteria bacterium]|nr:lytic transglycosylase domain-containing protein [Deltaproteobacteria bacterium]